MNLPARAVFLVMMLLGLAIQARAQVPANAAFVMSFFKADGGGGDERLYIGTSPDGLNWTTLNNGNPVWQPPNWAPFQNVVRDPSIIYENGWFWVAFTSGNYGNHAAFGLVKTQDFVNWTYLGNIPVPIPGATAQLTWNPCFFRDGDGSVYLFINISPDGGPSYAPVPHMQSYVTRPASADWTQWTTPVLLSLPSNNTNEFYCWKEGDTYNAIYVDFNASGGWWHVTSQNLVTGWGNPGTLTFWGCEGGNMLKKPGGGYRFLYEQNDGYLVSDSAHSTLGLFNGYVPFSDGVPITSDILMNNGKMIAMPGATTFATWAAANTPTDQAPLDAPDGDGISNLLKCALGLPAGQSDAANLPAASIITGNDGNPYLDLQFYRHRQFSGLSTCLQSSPDLSTWTSLAPISVTLMSDGSELVEGRAPVAGGNQFIRVQATQQ